MKVAVASPPIPESIDDGLLNLENLLKEAAIQDVEILCFPESYLPGYPGMPYPVEDRTPAALQAGLKRACLLAAEHQVALILPMDWYENEKLLNVAFVISADGTVLGFQTKNQLDPSEDRIWEAGTKRQIFEIKGLKFGISICHEGFRYPETVRWAAKRGAHIVFHPHFAGSDTEGVTLKTWGDRENPYYEKAMIMRSIENTIYFASSNYATRFAESASAVIAPDGTCLAHADYGKAMITSVEIDLSSATAFLAKRLKDELSG